MKLLYGCIFLGLGLVQGSPSGWKPNGPRNEAAASHTAKLLKKTFEGNTEWDTGFQEAVDRHYAAVGKERALAQRVARTHIKGEPYDADVKAMMTSLMKEHGMSHTAVYRYVDQGMDQRIIFDLNDFKQQCIDKSREMQRLYGQGSTSKSRRED